MDTKLLIKIVFLAPTVGLDFLLLMPKNRLTKSIIQRDIRQELPDKDSERTQSRNRKALLILLPHRLSSTHRQGDNTSDYTIIRSEVHILNYLTIDCLRPSDLVYLLWRPNRLPLSVLKSADRDHQHPVFSTIRIVTYCSDRNLRSLMPDICP